MENTIEMNQAPKVRTLNQTPEIHQKPKSGKVPLTIERIIVYIILIFLSLLCLVPFYILLVNASHSNYELQQGFQWWFGNSFAKNWTTLFGRKSYLKNGIFNSIFLALINATLTVYFSALTAYATHVYRFKGRKFVETFILAIMMIPTQVSAMGLVMYCMKHGLKDNYLILILPSIAAPSVYFYMKQYLESILPYEIVEAARVDGTTELGIFHRIVLPIIKPALAVQFIFAYVGNWNNYFTPSMLIEKYQLKTIPLILAEFAASSPDSFDLGVNYMLITLAVIPVMIVYFIFSKAILKNLTNGAVKG